MVSHAALLAKNKAHIGSARAVWKRWMGSNEGGSGGGGMVDARQACPPFIKEFSHPL